MKGVSRAGALANSFMRLPLSLVLPFALCSPFRIPAATLHPRTAYSASQNKVVFPGHEQYLIQF